MSDEREVESALLSALEESIYDEDGDGVTLDLSVARVDTFESVGLLTRDRGVVVALDDGSEYQITIKRSR